MVAKNHPYMNSEYELLDDGRVEVLDRDTGQRGIFDAMGRWTEGELRFADIQFARWIAESA